MKISNNQISLFPLIIFDHCSRARCTRRKDQMQLENQ